MTSDSIRQLLWDQKCDAMRCARYWSAISARVHWRDRGLTLLSFVFASAVTLSVFTTVLGALGPRVLAALSLGVAAWSLWMKLARSTTVATKLVDASVKLEVEYELLWVNSETMTDEEVRSKLDELMKSGLELAKEAPTALLVNKRLNKQCHEEMVASLGSS